jgi:hypothetical protein
VRDGLALSVIWGSKGAFESVSAVRSTTRKVKLSTIAYQRNLPTPELSGTRENLRSSSTRIIETQDHVDVQGRRSFSRNCACAYSVRTSNESSIRGKVLTSPNFPGVRSTNYSQGNRSFYGFGSLRSSKFIVIRFW